MARSSENPLLQSSRYWYHSCTYRTCLECWINCHALTWTGQALQSALSQRNELQPFLPFYKKSLQDQERKSMLNPNVLSRTRQCMPRMHENQISKESPVKPQREEHIPIHITINMNRVHLLMFSGKHLYMHSTIARYIYSRGEWTSLHCLIYATQLNYDIVPRIWLLRADEMCSNIMTP